MSAGLVILALVAQTSSTASVALAPHLGPLGSAPFSVSADRLWALPKQGQFLAEGHVVVRRGDALLHAQRVTFDQATQTGLAEGQVTAVQGTTVLSCERVEMHLPELYGGLRHAELRIKNRFDLGLAERTEPEAWRRQGRDELIVEAEDLARSGQRAFEVEGATFTACDCGDDAAPSWRIRSHSASIDLDSGAFLSWPIFEIMNVPVFALPFFYVPLGERRSGLLWPRPSFSSATGPSVALPFYLVLGPSADLTLEGRYLSQRGPGAALEGRWAPSVSSQGQLNLAGVLDFGAPAPEGGWTKERSDPIPRWTLSAKHRTDFAPDQKLRVDLNLLGDPVYTADFAETFLSRQAEYGASRVVYTQTATVGLRFAVGAQLLQDLRTVGYFVPGDAGLRDVSLFSGQIRGGVAGTLLGPGAVRYRILELRQDAYTQPIASGWPIYGGARVVASVSTAPRPEVPRFVRADLRPALRVPVVLPLGLVLESELALRLSGWAGRVEGTGSESRGRVAPLGRADLHLELMRDYSGLTHRIRPELSYLLIPKVYGTGPGAFDSGDELDVLAAVSQFRARLATDLLETQSGQRYGGLEAWWGRDLGGLGRDDPAGDGNSELFLRLDAQLPIGWARFNADLRGAYDPSTHTVTEALLGGRLDLNRVALGATYGRVSEQLPRYGFLATEELVPSLTLERARYLPVGADSSGLARQDYQVWSAFEGVLLHLDAKPIAPLTISVDAVLTFGDLPSLPLGLFKSAPEIRNTLLQVRWDSPCECWGAVARAGTGRDQEGFFFNFALDLARLGGVSSPAL